MKENKLILFFSIVVSFITLMTSIFLTFVFSETKETIFISNILLNIFAGAIIVIPTSLIYYLIQRKRNLEDLMEYCNKLRNVFNNLEYLKEDDIESYEEFESNIKGNNGIKGISKKELKNIYEEHKKNIEEKNKTKLKKVLEEYIEISKISLSNFWKIYGDLHFINDYKNKVKYRLYNEVFDYTKKLMDDIYVDVEIHFKGYLSSENGNYKAVYSIARELQDKIFYYEEQDIKDNMIWKKDISISHKKSSGMNYKNNKAFIESNEVVDRYCYLFDEIGKIAYFNKKYGLEQKKEEEEIHE